MPQQSPYHVIRLADASCPDLASPPFTSPLSNRSSKPCTSRSRASPVQNSDATSPASSSRLHEYLTEQHSERLSAGSSRRFLCHAPSSKAAAVEPGFSAARRSPSSKTTTGLSPGIRDSPSAQTSEVIRKRSTTQVTSVKRAGTKSPSQATKQIAALEDELVHTRHLLKAYTSVPDIECKDTHSVTGMTAMRIFTRQQQAMKHQNCQLKRQVSLLEKELAARADVGITCDNILNELLTALDPLCNAPLGTDIEDRMLGVQQLQKLREQAANSRLKARAALRAASTAPETGCSDKWKFHEGDDSRCVVTEAQFQDVKESLQALAPQLAQLAITLRCHVLSVLPAVAGESAASLLAEVAAVASATSFSAHQLSFVEALPPSNTRLASHSTTDNLLMAQQWRSHLASQHWGATTSHDDCSTNTSDRPKLSPAQVECLQLALANTAARERVHADHVTHVRKALQRTVADFSTAAHAAEETCAAAVQQVVAALESLQSSPTEGTLKNMVATLHQQCSSLQAASSLLTSTERLRLPDALTDHINTLTQHWDAALSALDAQRRAAMLPPPTLSTTVHHPTTSRPIPVAESSLSCECNSIGFPSSDSLNDDVDLASDCVTESMHAPSNGISDPRNTGSTGKCISTSERHTCPPHRCLTPQKKNYTDKFRTLAKTLVPAFLRNKPRDAWSCSEEPLPPSPVHATLTPTSTSTIDELDEIQEPTTSVPTKAAVHRARLRELPGTHDSSAIDYVKVTCSSPLTMVDEQDGTHVSGKLPVECMYRPRTSGMSGCPSFEFTGPTQLSSDANYGSYSHIHHQVSFGNQERSPRTPGQLSSTKPRNIFGDGLASMISFLQRATKHFQRGDKDEEVEQRAHSTPLAPPDVTPASTPRYSAALIRFASLQCNYPTGRPPVTSQFGVECTVDSSPDAASTEQLSSHHTATSSLPHGRARPSVKKPPSKAQDPPPRQPKNRYLISELLRPADSASQPCARAKDVAAPQRVLRWSSVRQPVPSERERNITSSECALGLLLSNVHKRRGTCQPLTSPLDNVPPYTVCSPTPPMRAPVATIALDNLSLNISSPVTVDRPLLTKKSATEQIHKLEVCRSSDTMNTSSTALARLMIHSHSRLHSDSLLQNFAPIDTGVDARDSASCGMDSLFEKQDFDTLSASTDDNMLWGELQMPWEANARPSSDTPTCDDDQGVMLGSTQADRDTLKQSLPSSNSGMMQLLRYQGTKEGGVDIDVGRGLAGESVLSTKPSQQLMSQMNGEILTDLRAKLAPLVDEEVASVVDETPVVHTNSTLTSMMSLSMLERLKPQRPLKLGQNFERKLTKDLLMKQTSCFERQQTHEGFCRAKSTL